MENDTNQSQQEKNAAGLQSITKFLSYLETLNQNPDFIAELKELRKKINIPKYFQTITEPSSKKDKIYLIKLGNKTKVYDSNPFEPINKSNLELFDSFAKKYGLNIYQDISYLLYLGILLHSNDSIKHFILPRLSPNNICFDLSDCLERDEYIKKNIPLLKEEVIDKYPIAILIHPYMTERDIIDLVKKTYKSDIEPLQKKYRKENITLGKSRKKSRKIAERNKLIYDNRNKPISEINTIINTKYGKLLEHSQIRKIIKDQEKLNDNN